MGLESNVAVEFSDGVSLRALHNNEKFYDEYCCTGDPDKASAVATIKFHDYDYVGEYVHQSWGNWLICNAHYFGSAGDIPMNWVGNLSDTTSGKRIDGYNYSDIKGWETTIVLEGITYDVALGCGQPINVPEIPGVPSGKLPASYCLFNPQSGCGSNVASRIFSYRCDFEDGAIEVLIAPRTTWNVDHYDYDFSCGTWDCIQYRKPPKQPPQSFHIIREKVVTDPLRLMEKTGDSIVFDRKPILGDPKAKQLPATIDSKNNAEKMLIWYSVYNNIDTDLEVGDIVECGTEIGTIVPHITVNGVFTGEYVLDFGIFVKGQECKRYTSIATGGLWGFENEGNFLELYQYIEPSNYYSKIVTNMELHPPCEISSFVNDWSAGRSPISKYALKLRARTATSHHSSYAIYNGEIVQKREQFITVKHAVGLPKILI